MDYRNTGRTILLLLLDLLDSLTHLYGAQVFPLVPSYNLLQIPIFFPPRFTKTKSQFQKFNNVNERKTKQKKSQEELSTRCVFSCHTATKRHDWQLPHNTTRSNKGGITRVQLLVVMTAMQLYCRVLLEKAGP